MASLEKAHATRVFPSCGPASASLCRVQIARNQTANAFPAIATEIVPLPEFAATCVELYMKPNSRPEALNQ